jgi:hypothetical protein
MLQVKTGVLLAGLQPEMLIAIDAANLVYSVHNKDCVITSARGDTHSNHSHHYKGLAVDLRTRHLVEPVKIKIVDALQTALGAEYQVIPESTHIHVEYDPKQP